jgi:hypothetical protein
MVSSDVKWSKASFRVFSSSLTAAEITTRLELTPTRSHEAGDPVSLRRLNAPVRHKAGWLLESGLNASEPMDRHLSALLEQLEPKLDRLQALASACRMDFFCGFSSRTGQGGFTLEPELLARLALIPGLGLDLDLYPQGA